MTHACRPTLAAAALAALAGCIGVADPMPSPEKPDQGRVLVSATDPLRQDGPVDTVGVIGLPRAAPKAGFIVLHQLLTGTVTTVHAAADGTFAAVLAASAGDRLELTFKELADGPESDPVELNVVRWDAAAAPNSPTGNPAVGGATDAQLKASTPEASAPDGTGRTHVTGTGLTPGDIAAIGNVRTGQVLEVTVPLDGKVEVALAAAVNDTIVVIVRNPTTGLTSKVASLSVPQS